MVLFQHIQPFHHLSYSSSQPTTSPSHKKSPGIQPLHHKTHPNRPSPSPQSLSQHTTSSPQSATTSPHNCHLHHHHKTSQNIPPTPTTPSQPTASPLISPSPPPVRHLRQRQSHDADLPLRTSRRVPEVLRQNHSGEERSIARGFQGWGGGEAASEGFFRG